MFIQPKYDLNESRLLWLDLETTGLNPQLHSILEAAAVVTDNDLNILGSMSAVIHQPDDALDLMNKWCTTTHTESGLVAEVKASETSLDQAEMAILALLEAHDAIGCVMAGSSITFDRTYVNLHMETLAPSLHYRNLDVRPLVELAGRWYPECGVKEVMPEVPHRAMPDILASIKTLSQIKKTLDAFLPRP